MRAMAAPSPFALPDLHDPRVPPPPLGEPRPDLREELVDDVAVRDVLEHLPARMDVTTLGERDQVLGVAAGAPSPSPRWSSVARG